MKEERGIPSQNPSSGVKFDPIIFANRYYPEDQFRNDAGENLYVPDGVPLSGKVTDAIRVKFAFDKATLEFSPHIEALLRTRENTRQSADRNKALAFLSRNITFFARSGIDVPIYNPVSFPPVQSKDLYDLLKHPEMERTVDQRTIYRKQRKGRRSAENTLMIHELRAEGDWNELPRYEYRQVDGGQAGRQERVFIPGLYDIPMFVTQEFTSDPQIFIREKYTVPVLGGRANPNEVYEWNMVGDYLLRMTVADGNERKPQLYFLREQAQEPHKHLLTSQGWVRLNPDANPDAFSAEELAKPPVTQCPNTANIATDSQIATKLALLYLSGKTQ